MVRSWSTCGAGALFVSLLAPYAWAGGAEIVPEEIWWGARMAPSILERPLRAADMTIAVELESEWTPLYRDGEGARIDGTRRAARWFGASRPWHGALEVADGWSALRGGGERLRLGAEEIPARKGILAVAHSAERGSIALALSMERDLPPGFGVEGRVLLLPGAWFETSASQAHVRGILNVSWDDTEVRAPGRWLERRAQWRIAATRGHAEWALGQEALDRRGAGGGGGDHVDPWLGWRETRLSAATQLRGFRWRAEVSHGDGFQSTRVRREGTSYANVEGPVRRDGISFALGPAVSDVRMRMWAGRWTGDGAGVLALWPFEPLTALTGTRRAGHSSAMLSHRGMALERDPAERNGWKAGIALWALSPRADYSTWQTTFLGLGRDDYSEGASTLDEVWLLGLKAGGRFDCVGLRVGVEAVQWLPVRVREAGGADGDGTAGGGSGGEPGPIAHDGSTRGGTVLRVHIGAHR